jgi:ATP-binding cassette subfamily B protein
MGHPAFTRALKFLNYNPVAKWTAQIAAVGTGVLFVGLLTLLGLFAELVVERGEIPCFSNLASGTQDHFLSHLQPEDYPDIRRELKDSLGIHQSKYLSLITAADQGKLTIQDQEVRDALLWYGNLPVMLRRRIGETAATDVEATLRGNIQELGLEMALNRNLPDYGILGLVTRTHGHSRGGVISFLVSWNSWMWEGGNVYYLEGLFILAVILAVARAFLMYLSSYMAAVATMEAATRLRRSIYHQTYRLGSLAVRALGPSEAVGVSTRHLEAVHDALLAWLTVVFREPVKFGLLLLFALLVNFWIAVAFFVSALLVWLIGGQMASYFRRLGRQASHRAADQLALIQESLMIMRLVKVYLMELFNQARVERQLARFARAQLLRYSGEAIYRPLFVFLALLAALVLLLLAGFLVLYGQLGVTSGLVMVAALISLYWPLVTWLDNRRYLRRGRESATILFNFLDRPGGVGQVVEAEFLPPLTKQLEFDSVTLEEPGTGRKLLQGVSFAIPAGQKVAIVGPEEMEKHALVYLIPRFLDPTSGEIRMDRHNLRWVTLDSLRAQIAIVLQHNLVFNDTVANNIGCGEPTYKLPQIIEAAKIAHAHHFIQKLPQGYETPIGEMGHPLSISENFRIAIARAILREPSLLIIEEPAVPMDEDTKSVLDDTYARILPGRTTIFLPHRLSTIRNCDRVFFLYQGRIEAVGDHKELLARNDLYRHLQYLEFNEFAGILGGAMVGSASHPEL